MLLRVIGSCETEPYRTHETHAKHDLHENQSHVLFMLFIIGLIIKDLIIKQVVGRSRV